VPTACVISTRMRRGRLAHRRRHCRHWPTTGLSPTELAQIDRDISQVLTTSRAVIEARNSQPKETIRRLADGRAAGRQRGTTQAGLHDCRAAGIASRARARSALERCSDVRRAGRDGRDRPVCAGGALLVVQFDRQRGIAMQEFLRLENERLEQAVRDRSATLAQANRELTWFSKRALEIQEQERRNLALEFA